MEYKRKVMDANVSWITSKAREWTEPSVCPDGYVWDEGRHCWPKKCWKPVDKCASPFLYWDASYEGCTDQHNDLPWCSHDKHYQAWSQRSYCKEVPCSPDSALLEEVETVVAKKNPSGTSPAECDKQSMYPEFSNGWCYSSCLVLDILRRTCAVRLALDVRTRSGGVDCGRGDGFVSSERCLYGRPRHRGGEGHGRRRKHVGHHDPHLRRAGKAFQVGGMHRSPRGVICE